MDINHALLTLGKELVRMSRVLEENILLPSLEEMVVLKLMSGDRKVYEDLKMMLHQTWHRLDKEYLSGRVRQAGLDRELRRILRRIGWDEACQSIQNDCVSQGA